MAVLQHVTPCAGRPLHVAVWRIAVVSAKPSPGVLVSRNVWAVACGAGKRRAADVPAGASLARVHEEAVGPLAELAALCLERLLSLGRRYHTIIAKCCLST